MAFHVLGPSDTAAASLKARPWGHFTRPGHAEPPVEPASLSRGEVGGVEVEGVMGPSWSGVLGAQAHSGDSRNSSPATHARALP